MSERRAITVLNRVQALLRGAGNGPLRQRPGLVGAGAAVGVLAMISVLLSACGPAAPGEIASASIHTRHARPTSAVQDFNAAQALEYAGHCDRAVPLFLSALLKNSMYVSAYSALASCYVNLGSFNAAIAEYDKAIAIDPNNYGLYLGRAGAENSNGSSGAAIADLTAALRVAPAQAVTYATIAGTFAAYQDYVDAIKALDKAIALVPDNPSLYRQRADVYFQMQDYRHAYVDYNRAINAAPSASARVPLYASLANDYDQAQDFASAEGAIAAAIRLAPHDAYLYVLSGNIHRDATAYNAALGQYDHALRLVHDKGPYAQQAYEGKGNVYANLGQTQQAIAEYKQAARLTNDPNVKARIKSEIGAARSSP